MPKKTPKPQPIIRIEPDRKFIVLCAWCEKPDVDAPKKPSDFPLTKQYTAKGYRCSHGICDHCSQKHFL